jgi:hypothetical protein
MNTVWINPPFTYGTTVVMSDTSDLVSVPALPAIWSGHDASQIAGTLVDVLVWMLRLAIAYEQALKDEVARFVLNNAPPRRSSTAAQRGTAVCPGPQVERRYAT